MSLSRDQAADSLKEIERTSRRSAQAFSYASASPYLIVWGLIWMVGYAASDLAMRWTSPIWLGLSVIGVLVCMAAGRRQAAAHGPDGRASGLRFLASFMVIFVFVYALFAVIGPPANPLASGAVAPLLVAMFYGLVGVWKGVRFLVAGALVAGLTLAGYFWLPQHFLLWMAAVGGGSLVLAGVLLRQV